MATTDTATRRIGENLPANHAARAVDITTIWPEIPGGDPKRKQAAAVAGAKGESTTPMDPAKRADSYRKQNGGPDLTRRQTRRYVKKHRANGGA